jgi:predicted glycosyltransferase
VLVHGDPALFGLDATFPEAVRITDKLAYTGYVVKAGGPRQPAAAAGHGDVVVSVGGGAVGLPLIEAALAARPLCRLAGHVWRLIAGPNLPAEDYDRLAWEAPPGVVVERWRDDLPAILAGARLSISQAGYNTVMDVLAAGVPAIVVPFAAAAETEQTWRARAFAATGALTLLEARDLSPRRLAEAIDRSSDHGASSPAIDMTGAATSARLIRELQEARRSKNQLGQPPAQQ